MNYKSLVCLILLCGCGINPNQTYRVYTVIDCHGTSYHNLKHVLSNHYRNQQNEDYFFHGNYTVISSIVSGHDLIGLKIEKE